MQNVEIYTVHGTVVLRGRGSELLILPNHVKALKALLNPSEFVTYFKNKALINRPARKMFEAWIKKDDTLWKKIYKTIQEIDSEGSAPAAESAADSTPIPAIDKSDSPKSPSPDERGSDSVNHGTDKESLKNTTKNTIQKDKTKKAEGSADKKTSPAKMKSSTKKVEKVSKKPAKTTPVKTSGVVKKAKNTKTAKTTKKAK